MHDVKLTPGSTYRVVSAETSEDSIESEGIFRGFVGLGNVDALILEVDEDRGDGDPLLRLIPAHTVRFLEILEDVTEDEEEDDAEHMHYG